MTAADMFVSALIFSARRSPLGRGFSRRTILSLIDKLAKTPFRTTYRGVPITLHMDNTTERKALLTKYDHKEMEFLASFLKNEGSVFVDLGANSGLYTQWLAANMPTASRIIAIEPNPTMRRRISENLKMLDCKPDVEILPCGIGEHKGTMYLDTSYGVGAARLDDSKGVPIVVETLKGALESVSCKSISALKIDIEGHEDRALMPFFETCEKSSWPKAIVIETAHRDDWKTDIVGHLMKKGYVQDGRTRSNALLRLSA